MRLFRFWKYEIKDYFNKTYCCSVHRLSFNPTVEIYILKSVKDLVWIRYALFMGKKEWMAGSCREWLHHCNGSYVLLSRYRNGSTKLQESIYNAIIGCNPKTIVYQYNACIKIKQWWVIHLVYFSFISFLIHERVLYFLILLT